MSDLRISHKYDTRLNLRHAKVLTGVKRILGHPVLDGRGQLTAENGASQAEEHDQVLGLSGRVQVHTDATPYVENNDPWKVRIPRLGRTWLERVRKQVNDRRQFVISLLDNDLPMQAKMDMLRSGRELTPSELNDIRETEEAQRLDEFHRTQAIRARNRIIDTLTRLKHCHYVDREGEKKIKAEVQIDYIEFNPLYYRFWVNASKLPFGVSIMDIQGDGICTDLSASVGHPVRDEIKIIGNQVVGLQYTVEIAATMGVPNQCKFSDLLPLMPSSAPSLAFITGYSEGKRLRWANLETMPHLLGGGQTLGGKSNMLHNILGCFISRNVPNDLRLALMDMKFDSGIELRRYRNLPHLITRNEMASSFKPDELEKLPENVAMTPADAIYILRYLVKVSNQRGRMFAKEDIQNLRQWNRKHPNRRMPYIVAVIDELSNLRTDAEVGEEAYSLLNKILSTSRAAGISIIAFTQSSNKKVLDEFIKVNLPGRICFSMADSSSSQLFVNDGSAVNLSPAGRAIFKHGTDRYLVQTPLIEPGDILEVIRNAQEGKLTAHLTSRPVLPDEVIEWAVEYNSSTLSVMDVYLHFGGELKRIAKAEVEILLKEMEGKDYRINERIYQVLPGAGRKPRIVVCLNNAPNASPVDSFSDDGTQDESQSSIPPTDELLGPCPFCAAPRKHNPCEFCGQATEE